MFYEVIYTQRHIGGKDMEFSSTLKKLRKKMCFSQEQLAEKLNVSRQAVTKWETGAGFPDIENIIAISKLFSISIDDLLLGDEHARQESKYLFESISEYDIDTIKCFDFNLGDARDVLLQGYDGEKLYVRLYSNTLVTIKEDLKVKIDDTNKRIDVDVTTMNGITKATLKEQLYIMIQIPNQYIKTVEVFVSANRIELQSLQAENIELDSKIHTIYLTNTTGDIDVNCNQDMQIICNFLEGQLSINQCLATTKLFFDDGVSFHTIKKGIGNAIYYETNGQKRDDFSDTDADNVIELNGIKSELIISTLKNGAF